MSPSMNESRFAPISPNPYIVGNPVRDPKMFFGREAEFNYVRKRFVASSGGGLLVFCGERRSGKTSILFQILDGRLGADFIPVLIDMQSMAIQNEIDFLSKISEEIVNVLEKDGIDVPPPDFGDGSPPSTAFLLFIKKLLEVCPTKSPILLFDEYELFENKIDSKILSEDVLHMLSHMMETYSIFLIFTGSRHLEERRREYWKILGRSLHRTISFLHHDDALRLIRQPVERQVYYDDDTDKKIFRLSAGQPFYTQAICQSLVDRLNAEETRHVTSEILSQVVADIVDNPFPQMIFLWESLGQDEKLVLGLLAESLVSDEDSSSSDTLTRLLSSRKYPLDLNQARIASALEKLFKQELLQKNDETPPGYSFRVDLWRHWVRRMHTVWQIMREQGIAIPKRSKFWRLGVTLTLVAAVAVVAVRVVPIIRGDGHTRIVPPPTDLATISISSERDATIFRDGYSRGMEKTFDSLPADSTYEYRISKQGYADTTFSVTPRMGESLTLQIPLRQLWGDIRVQTDPPGATVVVDGVVQSGTSPLIVRKLPVADGHRVLVSLPGYNREERDLTVQADTMTDVTFAMSRQVTDVLLVTSPTGADTYLDEAKLEKTPFRYPIPVGQHHLRFVLSRYISADTTLEVTSETRELRVGLNPEPPGFLTIKGDRPAHIYVDQKFRVGGVQNSGKLELQAGVHGIRVVVTNGEIVVDEVVVGPGEAVVYDYTMRRVVSPSQEEGPTP